MSVSVRCWWPSVFPPVRAGDQPAAEADRHGSDGCRLDDPRRVHDHDRPRGGARRRGGDRADHLLHPERRLGPLRRGPRPGIAMLPDFADRREDGKVWLEDALPGPPVAGGEPAPWPTEEEEGEAASKRSRFHAGERRGASVVAEDGRIDEVGSGSMIGRRSIGRSPSVHRMDSPPTTAGEDGRPDSAGMPLDSSGRGRRSGPRSRGRRARLLVFLVPFFFFFATAYRGRRLRARSRAASIATRSITSWVHGSSRVGLRARDWSSTASSGRSSRSAG